jgi:hypothetical protein
MRAARTASSLGLSEAALTFLNRPAGFRRRAAAGLGKCGKGVPETEEAASWAVASGKEPLKKPDVLHPAGADHQDLSLSRQRPLLAMATECRADTKLAKFDDRISELASNIDEARRHRNPKLRG